MRITFAAILIALTIPSVWAQKYPKPGNSLTLGRTGRSDRRPLSLHIRSLRANAQTGSHPAAASVAAPGVVQLHLEPSSGSLVAYFINSATIPAGSIVTGTITLLDDGSFLDLDQVQLSQALPAGSTILLPEVSVFGDLVQQDTYDYTVQVITGGVTTQADGFVSIGEALAYSDLAESEPVISSTAQRINSNKDMIVAIGGYFTSDAPLVIMDDLYANYVVPASAINLVSSSEIDIDLSQVAGLDLTLTDELLLTVSQAGFADTVVYRYVPAAPGTFNLAPL